MSSRNHKNQTQTPSSSSETLLGFSRVSTPACVTQAHEHLETAGGGMQSAPELMFIFV